MPEDNKKTSKKSSKKQDKRVTELQQQVEQLTEDLKRAHADFVNYKRRAEQERQASVDFGKRDIIINLLPVFDTLDRALAHAPDDLKDHEWAQGIVKTAKQLQSQMESLGVVRIDEQGAEFDPEQHEAVSVGDSKGEQEVVAEVLQAGYKLNDNVIRPAMVKVERK